jgi:hypothetical protein
MVQLISYNHSVASQSTRLKTGCFVWKKLQEPENVQGDSLAGGPEHEASYLHVYSGESKPIWTYCLVQ